MTARLAADIGGTFTDLVLLDSGGGVHVAKTLSTPVDFKEGVLSGVERNTVGCRSGAGAGDRARRCRLLRAWRNCRAQRTARAKAAAGRAGHDGGVSGRAGDHAHQQPAHVRPQVGSSRSRSSRAICASRSPSASVTPARCCCALDEAGTREVARRIKALGIHSVALCFLHAYANPGHERRARELLLEEHPEAHVTISSDVASELREFERTSTVAINASTIPIISAYLDGLSQALIDRGLKRELFVMQSNGGVITSRTAPVVCRSAP